nr:hypothetical protein [Tanacetum cinerariifolium]
RKEKVVVSSDSEGSGADDFSELKKITTLLAKAFNRRKFYPKPINNNLRTSSTSHGEYSQWRERFMNYLEEQIDCEAMINSIQNGDQPLPVIAQVSLARNEQNAPPTLKDPKFWSAEEKKTRKIDHPLALVAEKTKLSKRKEKVVVSSDSEGSGADDFSELKKITALLAKAFN